MSKATRDLNRALDILEEVLDDIAWDLVSSEKSADTLLLEKIQEKVSRAYYLLDRSYPEYSDDGYGRDEELDFNDEPQSSFNFDEEEDR
jgi:hypothetical protein